MWKAKDWEKREDAENMLEAIMVAKNARFVQRKASLYRIACCKQIPVLSENPEFQKIVEPLEKIADWRNTGVEYAVVKANYQKWRQNFMHPEWKMVAEFVYQARCEDTWQSGKIFSLLSTEERNKLLDPKKQVAILLDICDHPLANPQAECMGRGCSACGVDSYGDVGWCLNCHEEGTIKQMRPGLLEWREANHGQILNMADDIYLSQRWNELPVLADALEDIGCWYEPLLEHLREKRQHHLGCWALDTIRMWNQ